MSKKTTPSDEALNAPQAEVPAYVPPPAPPRIRRIERQGAGTVPMVHHMPRVIGGVCEFCGVLDRNIPSQYQYKLCPHYRGMQLRCSYCSEDKDFDEVNYHAKLNITTHPSNPDVLVVVCDSYTCTKKHQDRFKVS